MHQVGDIRFLLVLGPSDRVLPVMCKATDFTKVVSSIAEVFILFLCRPVSWPCGSHLSAAAFPITLRL